jgi:putrescine importer
MGVNAAALVHYFIRQGRRNMANLLPPVAGFLICLALWLGLSRPAKFAGVLWMLAGIAFGAWKTKGFRGTLINFDLPQES